MRHAIDASAGLGHVQDPPARPSEPKSPPAVAAAPGPLRPVTRMHLTPAELERLTGIAEERLRSWARRFGYPTVVEGRPRYLASEVPGLIATKQLVASGLPVGAAIDEARRRDALPLDLAAVEQAFDALDVAVVGFQAADPATMPLARAYANAQAGDDFPRLSESSVQELLRMASHDHAARLIWTRCPASDDAEHEALAFAIGAPTFSPALVVVMDVPHEARRVRSRAEVRRQHERERAAVTGLARARRLLQVHGGAQGMNAALDAMRCGVGAVDAFTILRFGDALQGSISLQGRMLPARLPSSLARAVDAEMGIDMPSWLSAPVAAALGVDGACLAIPLTVSGRSLGYACLPFAEAPILTPGTHELLMAFGALQASVIAKSCR